MVFSLAFGTCYRHRIMNPALSSVLALASVTGVALFPTRASASPTVMKNVMI